MIQGDQGHIRQNLVALGDHAMRVTPHTKAIRRANLSHCGLEPAHPVGVVFQKNYRLAIHDVRAEQRRSEGRFSFTVADLLSQSRIIQGFNGAKITEPRGIRRLAVPPRKLQATAVP